METRLKTAEDFTIPKAYTLQKAEYVKELDSFTLVLKHNLSGARILVFSNEDDNKVFSIGFRTPPRIRPAFHISSSIRYCADLSISRPKILL